MHILYIHTHDTGKYTSVYGKNVPTENLKYFAADALVFEQAYCTNPTCSPSRTSLLTGTYPQKNGMLGLAHRGFELTNNNWHLAQFLRENGYYTVLSGIQHEHQRWLFDKGAESAQQALGYHELLTDKMPIKSDQDYVQWDKNNTAKAVKFIDNYNNDQPLFLSMGFFQTHREYPELTENEKEIYDERYLETPATVYNNQENRQDTAKLHKSLAVFDACFAQIIQALKDRGIYEDTLIISTTDHGLANPFAKASLTDLGTNVSLIMRHPQKTASFGKVSEQLISHVDVFPTICDFLNLEKPQHLQGKSFAALFENDDFEGNKYIFTELNFHTSYEPARAIRSKRYKLIVYYDTEWEQYNLSNIDDSPIKTKLMQHGFAKLKKPMHQLYDLIFDPEEKNNLYHDEEYADVKSELLAELAMWRASVDDKILTATEYANKFKVNKKSCISPKENDTVDLL